MRRLAALAAILALAGCSTAPDTAAARRAASPVLTGEVVAVADGDTLTVLVEGHDQVKIRLDQIDAPERKQPYGTASREALAALCHRQQASVVVTDVDRYGRSVGVVTCQDVDANRRQIETGMAWAYRKYLREPGLLEIEAQARALRRGLWQDDAPVPPWEWRRAR